jgi:hypothetical protein
MSVDHIKHALNTVKHPVSSSLSLPPACYHNQEWFGHEMDCLFCNGWFGVGRADQWQEPGDFVAINVAGIPVVIILDKPASIKPDHVRKRQLQGNGMPVSWMELRCCRAGDFSTSNGNCCVLF